MSKSTQGTQTVYYTLGGGCYKYHYSRECHHLSKGTQQVRNSLETQAPAEYEPCSICKHWVDTD